MLAVQIGLRWLPLFVLAIAAGLLTSKLVSRGGSYLIVPVALAVLFTVDGWRGVLEHSGLGIAVQIVNVIGWPVRTLLLMDPTTVNSSTLTWLTVAGLLSLLIAALLYWLAARSFDRKDLIWVE